MEAFELESLPLPRIARLSTSLGSEPSDRVRRDILANEIDRRLRCPALVRDELGEWADGDLDLFARYLGAVSELHPGADHIHELYRILEAERVSRGIAG